MIAKNHGDVLANWVRDGRKSMEWTQVDLAKRLGITTVQLSKIENGRSETTLATILKMCRLFGKSFVIGGGE